MTGMNHPENVSLLSLLQGGKRSVDRNTVEPGRYLTLCFEASGRTPDFGEYILAYFFSIGSVLKIGHS